MSVPAIFNSPTTENGHCTSGGPVTPEAARRIVLENIDVVSGTETVPPHAAVGRIAAEELLSAVALAGFDNAAVDGFGIHADDPAGTFAPVRIRSAADLLNTLTSGPTGTHSTMDRVKGVGRFGKWCKHPPSR
jgi:molybdopterin biosynthesis enzyme